MPLFNIDFPANAVLFYSLIVDISSFNILPTDSLKSTLFADMEEDESDA